MREPSIAELVQSQKPRTVGDILAIVQRRQKNAGANIRAAEQRGHMTDEDLARVQAAQEKRDRKKARR